jgi:cold shock CspA family protein
MAIGTVKWFNATKVFDLSSLTPAAPTYLCISAQSNGRACVI